MRAGALVFSLLMLAPAALAQDLDRYQSYQQTEAVRAHYPDVAIALDAPALGPGRDGFTSQQELQDFIAGLTRSSKTIVAGVAGQSQQGRDIPYLIATAEGLSDPAQILALGRPIVWLIGQQHGNEPAGGEAALAVASALARGELQGLTARVTVVIVPRGNPDGAAAFKRVTANGADPNRDHLLMLLPETRAIHGLMQKLPPDVVLDAHEFTVGNRWIAKFNALQAVDALLLSATHPMVSREVTQLADTVFRPRIEAALQARGLTSYDYYTTALSNADKTVSMGGNAPGAARNTFGLNHAVSFLIETRGVGIGRDGFERRVATHYLAAKAVLETAADQAGALRAAVEASRRSAAAAAADIVVAHKLGVRPVTLPMLDPVSGEAKPTPVEFRDSHAVVAAVTRPTPAGYLLPDLRGDAIAALRLNGVALCRTTDAAALDVEAFAIKERAPKVDREAINPDQAIKVDLVRKRIAIPAGSAFVPTAQPAGKLAALALEPDSVGSLAGVGLIPLQDGADVPIYRLQAAPKLVPFEPRDAAACGPQ
ncbi:MAG TPA: M14 family metallocarboxypeptidase [Xanthobacteraceae bacterium]|nr:M14 family metallocarboxypeptidase [Xanthobacteraceae bacterium]